jgi:hypothetical protein
MNIIRIAEVHSSDLTASCARYVFHRHAGETRPAATGALFEGLLFGEACRIIHDADNWPAYTGDHAAEYVAAVVAEATSRVTATLDSENRSLSDSVAARIATGDLQEGIAESVTSYCQRLGPLFAECTHIGCELPIRCDLPFVQHGGIDDGKKRVMPFASHLDLLVRDTNGALTGQPGKLVMLDWKYRDDAPTRAYLGRYEQFLAYWYAVRHGAVCITPSAPTDDFSWCHFAEWPVCIWLHAKHLAPFKRATKAKDDNGIDVEYKKGDTRPLSNVLRWVPYLPSQAPGIMADIATKLAMFEAQLFPKNPDPIGCHLCEAQEFCRRVDAAL